MSEKLKQIINKEGGDKFGRNVLIKMLFMRHGEKASQAGLLSEEGKKKLREQFKDYPQTRDRIKLSSANVGRNIQTMHIIEDSIKDERLGTPYIDTAFGYFPEKVGGITTDQDDTDFSDDFVDQVHAEINAKGESGAVQFYIDFDNQKPDEGTVSPKEMASKIAKRILLQTKMTRRLYSNSKVDLIQITGSMPFFPFLKEVIGNELEENPVNPNGTNFTEKMGGAWNFSEGVTIESTTDELGELQPLKISFRGKEYYVDFEKLIELAKNKDIKPRKYKLSEEVGLGR